MADQKISQLPTITGANMADNDKFVLVDTSGDATVATTRAEFFKSVPDVTFGDNDKAIFGAGSDLQIYHDGADSYVSDVGTGILRLNSNGTKILMETAGGETLAEFINNGNVVLYSNDEERLRTNGTGIDVTGTVTADGLFVDTDSIYSVSGTNRVGINKTSPATTLDVGGSIFFSSVLRSTTGGSASSPSIQPGLDGDTGMFWPSANNIGFSTAGTERMRIDSSGRVGIGTSSPTNVKTQINGSLSGTAGTGHLAFGETSAPFWNWRLNTSTADLILDRSYAGWQSTPVIAFDRSSGSVGIGTSSPSALLEVSANTGASIKITSTDTGLLTGETIGSIKFENNDSSGTPPHTSGQIDVIAEDDFGRGAMAFSTGRNLDSQEAMRIDSSGNVLVGTTSTTPAVSNDSNGTALQSNGTVQFSANATTTAIINRKSTDGAILQFRKDGSTVGSIGTKTSDLYIGKDASGLLFDVTGADGIRPFNTTTQSETDNTLDLGSTSSRFKDLYLSGGVVFGTGGPSPITSNTLDDYEEGTFTPVMTGVSGWSGSSGVSGTYTKIGNTVHVFILMTSNVALTGTPENKITGLPFSNNRLERSSNVSIARMYGLDLTTTDYIAGVSGTEIIFSYVNGGNNINNFTHSGSTLRLTLSATYQTA